MTPAADPLLATLRRWRRRLVLARIGDAVGLAMAAGAIATAGAHWLGWNGSLFASIAVLVSFGCCWRAPPSLAEAAAWLDRRYGLSDVLGSAWGVRNRDEAWAVLLQGIAAKTVVALPPAGRLGRVSLRHHACIVAGSAALLLTTLFSPPPGRIAGAAHVAAATVPQTDAPRHVANIVRRTGDSGASEARHSATQNLDAVDAGQSPRRTRAGDDANGTGRADAGAHSTVPPPGVASTPHAKDAGPGDAGHSGSGRAGPNGDGAAHGIVSADPPRPGNAAPPVGHSSINGKDASNAVPAPTAYREMIRDYFER